MTSAMTGSKGMEMIIRFNTNSRSFKDSDSNEERSIIFRDANSRISHKYIIITNYLKGMVLYYVI